MNELWATHSYSCPIFLCPKEGGRGGKAGCRPPRTCPWAGPAGPSAPHGFFLAGRCEDLQFFSVVAPLLKPAEPRFGLSLERNRASSLGAGLTLAACLWAVSCGLGEIKSKEKYFFGFFPPKPSQVPAQRAQGVLYSQLFSSKENPASETQSWGVGGLRGAEMLFVKPWAPDTGQSWLPGMLLAAFPSECTQPTQDSHRSSRGLIRTPDCLGLPTGCGPNPRRTKTPLCSSCPSHAPETDGSWAEPPQGQRKRVPQVVSGCCPPSPPAPPSLAFIYWPR